MEESIHNLIRTAEKNYTSGGTEISQYVSFDLKDNVDKIEAYLNSKHISGTTDSLGREKPFFNIVTAATNIWFRATDIDRKNIKVKPTKEGDVVKALLATIRLQKWMRENNFGAFLNDWGRVLARYGSATVKFVEKGSTLFVEVVPWNRLIIDPIELNAAPVIEKLYFTPSQLRNNKAYDQDVVKTLINTKQTRENLSGQNKDNKADYIEVYEIHGELPLSHITDNEDDKDTYVQQMHVVATVQGKNGEHEDFTLIKGREKKNPYMLTHLIKEDGRVMSIGAVEHLFEAQWMVNHTAKTIKDQLDQASKLIYQTADDSFIGSNLLTNIEHGEILIHKENMPVSQFNNSSHDIGQLQNSQQVWKQQGNEIVNISESMMGGVKSGTAWRQTEAVLQESHSLFELMTENKGLYIEQMLREYVLPNIKKNLNNRDEIAEVLDSNMLREIDSRYIPWATAKKFNEKVVDDVLEKGFSDVTQLEAETEVRSELEKQGNTRFFVPSEASQETWKEILEDMEWDLEVDVTGEQAANQENLATMTTLFQTIVGSSQEGIRDKNAQMILGKILMLTGTVSPAELIPTTAPAPQADTQAISQLQEQAPANGG